MASSQPVLNRRNVGSVAVYYVCYRLSRMGWTVAPAAANAAGVDLLVCGPEVGKSCTLKVKALSRIGPVPFGLHLDVRGDFVVICRRLAREVPECFVMTTDEVTRLTEQVENGGKTRFWLNPEKYDTDEFRGRWDRIAEAIGC